MACAVSQKKGDLYREGDLYRGMELPDLHDSRRPVIASPASYNLPIFSEIDSDHLSQV